MKVLGGVLGIFGGLLAVLGCIFYVAQGAAYGIGGTMGGIDPGMGVAGGLAALTCIVMGIVVLLGGRWLAGAFLLAAALIAMLVVGLWLGAPAVIGGALAIIHGHRRLTPEDVEQRLDSDRRRLEQELERRSRA
jgi:hypothetical protein